MVLSEVGLVDGSVLLEVSESAPPELLLLMALLFCVLSALLLLLALTRALHGGDEELSLSGSDGSSPSISEVLSVLTKALVSSSCCCCCCELGWLDSDSDAPSPGGNGQK